MVSRVTDFFCLRRAIFLAGGVTGLCRSSTSPLQNRPALRPANLCSSGSLRRYSDGIFNNFWKLMLIWLNPSLLSFFIEETPRESKKRKMRTSLEMNEGTFSVRANKNDQSISQNLTSRISTNNHSSYVQRPDNTGIKQPPKYPIPR